MLIAGLLTLSATLAYAGYAFAIDFTPSGAVLAVTYTEPSTNSDGSTLNDLAKTNVYSRVCPVTGTCAATFTKGPDVAASKAAGGGAINTTVTVTITPGQERNVEVYATATDLSGNESVESLHVTKRVDRLSPAEPK